MAWVCADEVEAVEVGGDGGEGFTFLLCKADCGGVEVRWLAVEAFGDLGVVRCEGRGAGWCARGKGSRRELGVAGRVAGETGWGGWRSRCWDCRWRVLVFRLRRRRHG